MPAYRVITRIAAVAEDLWVATATASIATAPRQGIITRQHECASREQAVDFLEILLDQVRSAVEATGGEVIQVVSVDEPTH